MWLEILACVQGERCGSPLQINQSQLPNAARGLAGDPDERSVRGYIKMHCTSLLIPANVVEDRKCRAFDFEAIKVETKRVSANTGPHVEAGIVDGRSIAATFSDIKSLFTSNLSFFFLTLFIE